MSRFDRSLKLASASAKVLSANRSLLLLPLLSLVASGAVFLAAGAPVLIAGEGSTGQLMIIGAITLLIVGLVQAYFHAALTVGALDHFEGRTPTLASTTAGATVLFPVLLGWALIGWVISAVAAVIRDRIPLVGPIVASLGEGIWGVVTYLSMPVIVVERVGPVRAIRRSGSLLRETWGENLLAQLGFGLYSLVLLVPVGIVGFIGYAIHPWLGIALLAVGILGVVCYISAIDAIYRVALYRYASMSETPAEFELAGFDAAFTTRKRRWF